MSSERCNCNLKSVISEHLLRIKPMFISCELARRWMWQDTCDDESILVYVIAWCHQATSHNVTQCGSWSKSPYGSPMPQWVKSLREPYRNKGTEMIWFTCYIISFHMVSFVPTNIKVAYSNYAIWWDGVFLCHFNRSTNLYKAFPHTI